MAPSQRFWILKTPSILQLLSFKLSLQVQSPTKLDFQFFWHPWFLDLISASQTVNLPHSIPSLLPTASFPSTFFLHTTAKLFAAGSPGYYLLHCLVIYHLISPITDFFFSFLYLWFTCCCCRKAFDCANTYLLQFTFPVSLSSQYCPGILLQTFSWFDFPFLLQNCSSIKPLLFSLSPHLSAVLLKSPPPPPSKSGVYILS